MVVEASVVVRSTEPSAATGCTFTSALAIRPLEAVPDSATALVVVPPPPVVLSLLPPPPPQAASAAAAISVVLRVRGRQLARRRKDA